MSTKQYALSTKRNRFGIEWGALAQRRVRFEMFCQAIGLPSMCTLGEANVRKVSRLSSKTDVP